MVSRNVLPLHPGRGRSARRSSIAVRFVLGLLVVAFVAPVGVLTTPRLAAAEPGAAPIVLAQEGGTEPKELEPRYPAPDPGKPGPYNEQERQGYNSDYLFGITRAVVHSTIVPAGKVPLFLLTVPLDIVFLPFAAIGGFFG
jgi:hypothetical protein